MSAYASVTLSVGSSLLPQTVTLVPSAPACFEQLLSLREVGRLARVAVRALGRVERLVVARRSRRDERAARLHLAREQAREARLVDPVVDRLTNERVVERGDPRVHEHVVRRRSRELLVAVRRLLENGRLQVRGRRILHVVELVVEHVLRLLALVLDDLRRDLVDVARRDVGDVERLELGVLLHHELTVRDRLGDHVRTDARGRVLGQVLERGVAGDESGEPHREHVLERRRRARSA